jgi:MYXO-CTERM domain-containing protein
LDRDGGEQRNIEQTNRKLNREGRRHNPCKLPRARSPTRATANVTVNPPPPADAGTDADAAVVDAAVADASVDAAVADASVDAAVADASVDAAVADASPAVDSGGASDPPDGSVSASTPTGGDSSGCGCRTTGAPTGRGGVGVALIALGALAVRRRQGSRA